MSNLDQDCDDIAEMKARGMTKAQMLRALLQQGPQIGTTQFYDYVDTVAAPDPYERSGAYERQASYDAPPEFPAFFTQGVWKKVGELGQGRKQKARTILGSYRRLFPRPPPVFFSLIRCAYHGDQRHGTAQWTSSKRWRLFQSGGKLCP